MDEKKSISKKVFKYLTSIKKITKSFFLMTVASFVAIFLAKIVHTYAVFIWSLW